MQQVSLGVMQGKKDSVSNEARQALYAAQQQLNAADLTADVNVDKLLTDLAFGYANRAGGSDQFEVIMIAGARPSPPAAPTRAAFPPTLRRQVVGSTGLLMTTDRGALHSTGCLRWPGSPAVRCDLCPARGRTRSTSSSRSSRRSTR